MDNLGMHWAFSLRINRAIKSSRKVGGQLVGDLQVAAQIIGENRSLVGGGDGQVGGRQNPPGQVRPGAVDGESEFFHGVGRSEEHTSELQSLRHLVCRLLLEKKDRHCSPPPGSAPRWWPSRISMPRTSW